MAIFDDLGSGQIYGALVATAALNGTDVSIPLNGSALAALRQTSGQFAVGGALLGFDRFTVLGCSPVPVALSLHDLVLTTADVPEPNYSVVIVLAFIVVLSKRALS